MSSQTQALVLKAVKTPLKWQTITVGPVQQDELLVDIHATGICHTDVACMNGRLPVQLPQILGHEGAGVVVKVGRKVLDFSPGDKVILSYNHCGSCKQCMSNHPAYCEKLYRLNFGGRRLDGTAPLSMSSNGNEDILGSFFGQSSFSRRTIVNVRCAVKVDGDADLAKLAPLGCGLQTGAGAVLNTLNVQKNSSFVVFGAGTVGLSAIMVAKLRGASPIIAVDLNEQRRKIAKELGAHFALDGSDQDLADQIVQLCPPTGASFAADTTGAPGVIEIMIECLGTRGRAASIGSPPPGSRVAIEVFAHLNHGREYVGCTQGDSIAKQMIPYLMEQHRCGSYPFDRLIHYYNVEDFQQALDDMHSGKVFKPVLKWV